MSFDPFTNDEVRSVLEHQHDLQSFSEAKLWLYFQKPVMCLLRIEKSIENWIKEMGANGYFIFLEETIGEIVEKDLKMNFFVEIS